MLVQEKICPLKINQFYNKVVVLLTEDIKFFGNRNCNKDHDHFSLDLSQEEDKECFNEMIRRYIYHLTFLQSKEFLKNNFNNNNDIQKVKKFVNNFDGDVNPIEFKKALS